MAKKRENLEKRLKKAAKKGKSPTEPSLKTPSKVAEERAPLGRVKLRRPTRVAQEPLIRTETPFGPLNWWLLAGGVVMAAIGFIFLYLGDTIISTTLLVLGYCVVIPVALLINPRILKKKPSEEAESKPEAQPRPEIQPEPGVQPKAETQLEPEAPEEEKKEGGKN